MKLSVAREALLERLQTLVRVASTHSAVQALSGVQVDATDTDVELRATDLEVGLRMPLEGEVALVTGRSFHFTRPIADLLPIPLTLIVNNGAVVKDKAGTTALRQLLPRAAAREVLAGTRAYEDSVALVFDRPGERQIVFDRMDWSHPHRRGYYEKNKPFIAAAAAPLADVLTEDPIQVMFGGSIEAYEECWNRIRHHIQRVKPVVVEALRARSV